MKPAQPLYGKNYFISIFIFCTLIFIAFSSVLYRQYTDARYLSEDVFRQYELLRRARLVYVDLLNLETGARGYMLTGKRDFLRPYEASQKFLNEHINAVRAAADDPEHETQLLAAIEQFKSILAAQIAQYKGPDSITAEMLNAQKTQMDDLRKVLETFLRDSQLDLQNQLFNSAQRNREFISVLLIGTALAICAMLLITLVMLSLLARNRRAEEKIKESEERMLTIMNGINDGLFDFDMRKNEVYFSPSYRAMLGYTEKEHPNTMQAFKEHLHPDDTDLMTEISRDQPEREDTVYSRVFRLRHKDGGWRWILSRGIIVRNQNGELTRLIGTYTDITEHKIREEELKQLNSDMESFIYIASHDLRSPLVNLKGFAGEIEHALRQSRPLLDRAKLKLSAEEDKTLTEAFNKDIPESLNFITKAVEKMDRLTSAILDLSRIGRHELKLETVDVNALVKRSLESMAYVISEKDVEVMCEPLTPIVSDGPFVEHIFNNLIDNAIKYVSPERRGKIVISSQKTGRDVIFSIKDNGRGIAREDRKKIFEIFRRARNTGDVQGLGMGMAYVKATARKLGGSIWLDSELNEGTTFYVRLPAYLEGEKARAGEQ